VYPNVCVIPLGCDGPVTVTVKVLAEFGVISPQSTILVISKHPALYVFVIVAEAHGVPGFTVIVCDSPGVTTQFVPGSVSNTV
jgi:hypothetical protein